MPLVSVIIPVYNSHKYLQEAIDSVLTQTFTDYEIIVVNDGSTSDETLNVLNSLPSSVSVIHKENGGLSSARNYGIARSKGDVILTLDSDDKFGSSFLTEAIEILSKKNDVGVVSSYVKEFGDSSKTWRTTAFDDFSFLTENRIVSCCAFRKKCWIEVNGYDEQMRSGYEDWEFWIRVTRKGWKVHVIPKKLFFYRKSSSSMLASETKPRLDMIVSYMVRKHQDWFVESLKKGIKEKTLINKKNLTTRRILGLFIEKITGKF